MIGLSLSFFSLFLIGGILLKLLLVKHKVDNFLFIPASFLLGSGVAAWQLMIYSFLGIEWSLIYLMLPWLFLAIFVYKKKRVLNNIDLKKTAISLDKVHYFLIAIVVMQLTFLVFRFFLSLDKISWDAMAIWFFKAKAFFIDGGVSAEFLVNKKYFIDDMTDTYFKSNYPILIPLNLVWVFMFLGQFSISAGKLLWLFYFLSLVMIYYYVLKKYTNAKLSLLFAFLLLTPQAIFEHFGRKYAGYAELPLASFLLASVSFWIMGEKEKNKAYKIIALLFASFAAFTKNDGLPFLLIIGFLIKDLKLFIGSFIIVAPWYLFRIINKVSSFHYSNIFNIRFERIPIIISAFYQEMFNLYNFNIIWLVFIFVVVYAFIINKDKLILKLILIVLLMLSSYFYAYLLTKIDVVGQLGSSLDRVLFQVIPIVLIVIALVFNQLFYKTSLDAGRA